VALRTRNSAAESGRELFKGSKDMVSPLVDTQNKLFRWGMHIFGEWRHE